MQLLQGPEYTWSLWSTTGFLSVAGTAHDLQVAQVAIEPVLNDVEMAASRFRPDSDVSRLARADGQPVIVSDMTIDLVETALVAAEQTDGLVDPTLGAALQSLGYDRTIAEVRSSPGPVRAMSTAVLARPSWRDVEVDLAQRSIRVPRGVVLDLGASAKARAADLAVVAAHAATELPVIVGLGGDLSVLGTPSDSDGWPVRIAETPDQAADPEAECPTITLASGGLATSTTLARRWRSGDRWVHHLLDPRQLQPVDDVWRTASVVAATCVDANTASTAALILGSGATQWLTDYALPARLVSVDGQAVAVAGWPKEAL